MDVPLGLIQRTWGDIEEYLLGLGVAILLAILSLVSETASLPMLEW